MVYSYISFFFQKGEFPCNRSQDDHRINTDAEPSTSNHSGAVLIQSRRTPKICPICHRGRVNLPSHMTHKHKWPKEKASKINCLTNQRTLKKPKKRVKCPKNGCFAYVVSLRDHFRNKHKEMISSRQFYSQSQINNVETPCINDFELTKMDENSQGSDDGSAPNPTVSATQKDENNNVEHILHDMIENSNVLKPHCNEESSYEIPESLQKIIEDFGEWLIGPQGGGNKLITSKHNKDMIRRLCKIIGLKTLNDMLDDNILWRIFLSKKKSGEWRGQTARAYMVAMMKFMRYVCKDSRKNDFSNDKQRDLARDLITDLPNWSKSYRNQIGIESITKKVKRAEVILSAEKIVKYRASEEYRKAIKLIGFCVGESGASCNILE